MIRTKTRLIKHTSTHTRAREDRDKHARTHIHTHTPASLSIGAATDPMLGATAAALGAEKPVRPLLSLLSLLLAESPAGLKEGHVVMQWSSESNTEPSSLLLAASFTLCFENISWVKNTCGQHRPCFIVLCVSMSLNFMLMMMNNR